MAQTKYTGLRNLLINTGQYYFWVDIMSCKLYIDINWLIFFQYLDDELDSIDDVEKYEKAHNFKVMNSKL